MEQSLTAFKDMLKTGNYVVLDTETTGLERGEVVQIGIVESDGTVLFDVLVKPTNPIPMDATRIYGITNDMVADSPSFALLVPSIRDALVGRNVVVYNAVYDRKMLHQSAEAAGIEKTDWKVISNWWCAMEAFAEIYGDWNEYRQSYRWQKLTTACAFYRVPQHNAHTALADARMTLEVCKRMILEASEV
jgi:DNA polymerase-3 subunit epsilon